MIDKTKSPKKKKSFPKPPKSVPLPERVTPTGPIQMLSKAEVMKAAGVKSYTTLWGWIRAGIFPPPRQLGPEGGRHSAIAWIDREVYTALANKPRRFPNGTEVTEEA